MNSNHNIYSSGNTDGTPITQLRNDIPERKQFNDDESNYSIESIKTGTDLRQMIENINNDIDLTKKQEINTKKSKNGENRENRENTKKNRENKENGENRENRENGENRENRENGENR